MQLAKSNINFLSHNILEVGQRSRHVIWFMKSPDDPWLFHYIVSPSQVFLWPLSTRWKPNMPANICFQEPVKSEMWGKGANCCCFCFLYLFLFLFCSFFCFKKIRHSLGNMIFTLIKWRVIINLGGQFLLLSILKFFASRIWRRDLCLFIQPVKPILHNHLKPPSFPPVKMPPTLHSQ